MSRIIAVRHGEEDSLEMFKTDDGRILNREQAVNLADKGILEGVSSFTTRVGDKAIRSDRGQENYSLDNLPEF